VTLGPLVVKVSYAPPGAKDGVHAVYIATRPGTDLSVTADSIARMASRDISDDATYARYIGERPGVVANGEATGSSMRTGCLTSPQSAVSSSICREPPSIASSCR